MSTLPHQMRIMKDQKLEWIWKWGLESPINVAEKGKIPKLLMNKMKIVKSLSREVTYKRFSIRVVPIGIKTKVPSSSYQEGAWTLRETLTTMLHKARSKVSRTIISLTVEVKSLQTKKTTLSMSRTFTSSLQVEEPNRKSKRLTEECQPSLSRKFRKASRNWPWPLTTPASSSAIPWKSSNSRT